MFGKEGLVPGDCHQSQHEQRRKQCVGRKGWSLELAINNNNNQNNDENNKNSEDNNVWEGGVGP